MISDLGSQINFFASWLLACMNFAGTNLPTFSTAAWNAPWTVRQHFSLLPKSYLFFDCATKTFVCMQLVTTSNRFRPGGYGGVVSDLISHFPKVLIMHLACMMFFQSRPATDWCDLLLTLCSSITLCLVLGSISEHHTYGCFRAGSVRAGESALESDWWATSATILRFYINFMWSSLFLSLSVCPISTETALSLSMNPERQWGLSRSWATGAITSKGVDLWALCNGPTSLEEVLDSIP